MVMGIGDDIMGTGLARGAKARGRPIAFGDGRHIIWGPFSEEAFRHNPNIARDFRHTAVDWIDWHKGRRWYNKLGNGRWIWNYDFNPVPGEFYFDAAEKAAAIRRPGHVLIEPNVPWHKSVAVNKDWGAANFQALADRLNAAGFAVCQTSYGKRRLAGVQVIRVTTFRSMVAVLAGFDLVITPEGGMHHAAATTKICAVTGEIIADATPAIVIFGGFIPPRVTGYADQVNVTGAVGSLGACGSLRACEHCAAAMRSITVEEIYGYAVDALSGKAATAPRRVGGIP